MKLLRVAAQRSVVLLNEVPSNFIFGWLQIVGAIGTGAAGFRGMTSGWGVLLRVVLVWWKGSVGRHFIDESVLRRTIVYLDVISKEVV
jgi:hypothetical protein